MKRFCIILLTAVMSIVFTSCSDNSESKIIDLSRFDKTMLYSAPYNIAAVEYEKGIGCVERLLDKINSLDEEEMLPFPDDFDLSESVIIQSDLGGSLYMYIISASDDGICTFSGGLNEAGADERYEFSFMWDDVQNTIAEINAYITENQ